MNAIQVPAAKLTPPINRDAEQALLGALLIDNRAYDEVAGFLQPEHFAWPVHGEIYAAVAALILAGKRANGTTLRATFENNPALAEAGGVKYLAALVSEATSTRNAKDYGEVILDLAMRRALMDIAVEGSLRAADVRAAEPARDILQAHGKAVDDILAAGRVGEGLVALEGGITKALQRAEAAYKNEGRLTGITSGFAHLDRKTGGFQDGNLIILGARPSMGKTTVALNMMRAEAEAGKAVGFFSLEMSQEEVSHVLLAMMTGVPAEDQRAGRITGKQFSLLEHTSRQMRSWPFHIDDTAAQSVSAIRSKARQLRRRGKLDIAFVDHLSLVRPEGGRWGNRKVDDLTEITGALKAMAKELGIPVVVLCQLSRAVEMRENKRPILADLRDSGSIEQDADVVMFLYRDEYYLSREKPSARASGETQSRWQTALDDSKGKAELLLPKVRMGATGNIDLGCNLAASRFFDPDTASTAQEDMGL